MTQFSSGFEVRSSLGARRINLGRPWAMPLPRIGAALLLAGAGLVSALALPVQAQAPKPHTAGAAPQPAPAGASGAPLASTPELQQLWEAEQTWVRALTTNTPALLDQLVDGDFSFIGPDGQFEDRDAYLAGYRALGAQGVSVLGIDLHDVKMRDLGQTGIVTGRVVARVQMGQQTIVENVRFTRVYARRGQRWRMVAGQGTRLAPAP